MSQNIYIRPGDYIFLPAEGTDKVFVLGAVNRPTGVAYSSRTTVMSALAAAMGPTSNAYSMRAILLRGSAKNPQAAVVNLNAIYKGREKNFRLEPGDILWIAKEPWHKLEEYAKVAAESAATSIALQQSFDHFGGAGENGEPNSVTQQIGEPDAEVEVEPEPEPEAVPVIEPDPVVPDPVAPDPLVIP